MSGSDPSSASNPPAALDPSAALDPPATIVVQKYGGSSVATVEKINQVASRIAKTVASGHRVCVVVSAMAHTTDELLAKAKQITESPPRRELDMLLSCGERASMALLSMAVIEQGLEAISFTGSQCGIMTNDRHWGAEIVEVRPFRVTDELERGRVVIVAGFQGVSYKREITTLGRGGSDTTAVALAAALGAEYCEICSDVDGVYSADPRVVDAAKLLASIGHDDMLELAAHGAKVLHPAAVEFARKSKIALWARGTTSDGRGTRIDGGPSGSARGEKESAVGVSSQRNLVQLSIKVGTDTDTALTLLAASSISIAAIEIQEERTQIVVNRNDAPDFQAVYQTLHSSIPNAELTEARAVSVIGADVGARPESSLEILRQASELGLEILGLAISPRRLTLRWAIRSEDTAAESVHDRLVRSLHARFVLAQVRGSVGD